MNQITWDVCAKEIRVYCASLTADCIVKMFAAVGGGEFSRGHGSLGADASMLVLPASTVVLLP